MPITYNGAQVNHITYNGTNLDKVLHNGVIVFSGAPSQISVVITGNKTGSSCGVTMHGGAVSPTV